MINLSDRIPAHYSQRARTELASTRGALVMARNQAERARIDLARAQVKVR